MGTESGGSAFDRSAMNPWFSINGADKFGHVVQFYEDDSFLVESVSRLVTGSLNAGDSVVLFQTRTHREALEQELRTSNFGLDDFRKQGRYVSVDALETLAKIMVDELPEETRFNQLVGEALTHGRGKHRRFQVFGEMVALLWSQDRREAALRLEEFWNNLGKKLPFSLRCAYPLNAFSDPTEGNLFLKVCAAHSEVIPTESYTGLLTPQERFRSISLLQHKAKVLESETAVRRETEKSLDLRQRELTDFLENAAEGLHRAGPDGRIIWANPAQLQMLGYSAGEYVGHSLSEFYADPESFHAFWRRLMEGEVVHDFPATLKCNDGSRKQTLINSSGFWEGGKFLYTRCFIRDVTEQVELEKQLCATVAQLAETDRRKNEFLAMLGHELRNPLSAIANAITAANLDPARRDRALAIAHRQSDQLARLVDDLLDIARITQGKIALRKQPLALRTIVDRALEEAHPLVNSRRLKLSVSVMDEAKNATVMADSARIQQVFDNLLNNAAKFTEAGGWIEVSVDREGSEAKLRVRDSGTGISPEMLPHVFDIFVQAETALDRAHGGLGLGLTLARQLVEMHGGKVCARSAGLGKGSEFEVSLPVLDGVDSAKPAARAAKLAGAVRVLIVEDNVDAAESLVMLLELLGHEAKAVVDGFAALDMLSSEEFDAALVDIGLPRMDGYEVARRIRILPGAKSMLLAALTGYGQEDDKQRALAAGFDQHLVKPVEIERLEAILSQIVPARPA